MECDDAVLALDTAAGVDGDGADVGLCDVDVDVSIDVDMGRLDDILTSVDVAMDVSCAAVDVCICALCCACVKASNSVVSTDESSEEDVMGGCVMLRLHVI